MKKQLLLLVIILLPMVASADESGTCDFNLTWTFEESTGTLTIKGNGSMRDFTTFGSMVSPWFSFREKIVNVIIEEGISKIGDYALYGCSNLTSVIIPNSVTFLGNHTFENCTSLSSISLPDNITVIGGRVFKDCISLKSIVIPNGVSSIGTEAFQNCDSLESITIPPSLKTIYYNAFLSTYNIKYVYISDIGAWCNINYDTTSALISARHIYLNGDEIKDLIIPNGVTVIKKYVFYGFKEIKSLTLPNTVQTIGEKAFAGCSSIASFTIPNSVTAIGDGAFSGCESVTSIDIPNSITTIGEELFLGCTGLTSVTIPNGVTNIGRAAFAGCTSLPSVTIPNGVTTINGSTFNGCTNLTTINIPNGVTSIGEYAFYGCTGLTNITIPDNVVDIYTDAFNGCKSVKSITLGSGIDVIGYNTFSHCNSLTDVYCYATNVPHADTWAFTYSPIENACLHVPEGSLSLYKSHRVWQQFKKIVKIGKPEHTLTYILDNEIYKTYQIEEGETITPEEAPTKEGYTFSGWSEIPETMPAHDVTVTGTFSVNKYKLIYKVDGAEYKSYEVEYGATITPEEVPTKEGYTFSGWSEIPTSMPAHDVTVTGSFTKGAYKLIYMVDGETYKTISYDYGASIIPEPAPTKEGYTFSGWSEIPEKMPAHDVTVTGTFSINKYKLIYKVDGAEYKSYEVEYGATITPEEAPTKEGYTFSGWSEIPTSMPAHDVTVTGTFTINKYKLIYKVDGADYKSFEVEYGAAITPEEAPTKEGYTFSGWSEIPETMPAHDVTVTGTFSVNKYKLIYKVDGAEYKSYEVEYGATITPEEAPTKEGYTFSGWSEIPTSMPAHDVTVTGTFTQVVYVIDNVSYEVKDNSVSITDGGSYNGDIVLESTVVINNQSYPVTTIADGAFKGNTNITSVTIPNSVASIGVSAFEGCNNLTTIIIGKAVASIGTKAFANMSVASQAPRRTSSNGLMVKCYAESIPSTAIDAFENTPISDATLLVLDDLSSSYKNTTPWSGFGTIKGFEEYTGIDSIIVDFESGAKIYSLDGKPLNELQKGINIVKTGNGKRRKLMVK